MDERFALIREPEAEALKSLSPNAAKAFIAIKFGRRDGEKIAFGVRDLEEWGLKRDTASRALGELVEAGLLEIVEDSAFGAKRRRRVFRAAHTRGKAGLQSDQSDTGRVHSPMGRTMGGSTVRPVGLSAALQSDGSDTPSTFPPSLRSGGKGRREGEAGDPPAGRAAASKALRDSLLRIDEAAEACAMRGRAFMEKVGGRKAADFLARKFQRGDLTALQLRAALADPPNGLAREPSTGLALPAASPPERMATAWVGR